LTSRYSPEVIKETQRYWEEKAGVPVSETDAEEIITNMAGLLDLLARWDAERGAGTEEEDLSAPNDSPVTEAAQPQPEAR
jgi:hypothetical protein